MKRVRLLLGLVGLLVPSTGRCDPPPNHFDTIINYLNCDRSEWQAVWQGNGFFHTPHSSEGSPHYDGRMDYVTWDGSCWSATWDPATSQFIHTPIDGSALPRGASHPDRILNYLTWGGGKWTALRDDSVERGSGFYHVYAAPADQSDNGFFGQIVQVTTEAGKLYSLAIVPPGAVEAGQAVLNAINDLQANTLSGPILEAAILASQSTASQGAMPIPADVRRRLSGYVSEDALNSARFKIGDNGFANVAHLIEQGGQADAVTLVDVIVFRGPTEAKNIVTWAHELSHVEQYRQWGVRDFAVSYTKNWHNVEEPAYSKANGFLKWEESRLRGRPTP
jgi:Domain of unknown function (DUF4157)